jgi:hypothetical protein
MNDPKLPVLNLLASNLTATKDDGVTAAVIKVTSKWYNDQMMNAADGLVTVGMLDDGVMPSGLGYLPSEDHRYIVLVNVWTVNKFNAATGVQDITDEILRWKMVQKISQLITQNYATNKMRVRVLRDLDDPQATPYPLRRSEFEIETFFTALNLAV